jgi:hypothetical protein
MQLRQDSKVAEKVGYQNINHCRCLLVRDDVNLWPPCEEVQEYQEVLISTWL